MKKRNWLLLTSLLLAAALTLAKDVNETSLAQASERVRNSTKGKILSAKTVNSNGQITHKIQVLTPSGRVKMIRVPKKQDTQDYSNTKQGRPYKQDTRNNSADNRRSTYRDRSRHNSRLNTQPQTTNSRSRTQKYHSPARNNSENNRQQ